MAYIPDFKIEDILDLLNSASERHPEGARERDAIELAQIALLYTRHLRKEDDFVRYYKQHFDPSYAPKVSHEFSTREEADAWLASGSAEDSRRVRIAGKGFMVVQLPDRLVFMVAPLLEELDSE